MLFSRLALKDVFGYCEQPSPWEHYPLFNAVPLACRDTPGLLQPESLADSSFRGPKPWPDENQSHGAGGFILGAPKLSV
jgi:hypothetical protein